MKKIYIYSLLDENQRIRYIGKTTNIKRRFASHIHSAKNNLYNRHVINWINTMLKKDLKPFINIIEICNESNWIEKEIYWINYYKEKGCDLCNIADGGMGGTGTRTYTEEEKQKRRERPSKQFSRFSDDDKEKIWNLIKNKKKFKEVQEIYPNMTMNIYCKVKAGRHWLNITKLNKI